MASNYGMTSINIQLQEDIRASLNIPQQKPTVQKNLPYRAWTQNEQALITRMKSTEAQTLGELRMRGILVCDYSRSPASI